ncbi:MAG: hypothetical protein AAF587_41765 [Bacteroidota bacterium]
MTPTSLTIRPLPPISRWTHDPFVRQIAGQAKRMMSKKNQPTLQAYAPLICRISPAALRLLVDPA